MLAGASRKMRTICLSASLKYVDLIRETLRRFEKMGIHASFPNLDSGLDKEKLDLEMMGRLCQDHFRAIGNADALYVIDPKGYIGTLVKVEIGYALGKGQPVYFSEPANALALDSLATGVVALDWLEQFLEL